MLSKSHQKLTLPLNLSDSVHLAVFVIFIIVHPGQYLPSPYKGFGLSKKTRNAHPQGVVSPFSLSAIVGGIRNQRIPTSDSEAMHLQHMEPR